MGDELGDKLKAKNDELHDLQTRMLSSPKKVQLQLRQQDHCIEHNNIPTSFFTTHS